MTMQSLNELTEAMMANTTFSKDEIESGEGMLLTFTKIGKDVFPQATAAVLDFAQKMGTDPKTAALQLGKALNDPATGLSKLTKSGVTFTDQQKKQITAMEKAGNVAGAQKLMIAELNKEFGGQAAAAADTYAGKQKQLANMMKELKEVIGSAVIPVLNAMLKPITPILQAIAKFVSENPKLMVGILALVGVIGTLIGGLSLANTVAGLFGHTMRLNEVLMTGGVMLGIMALIAAVALIITHWKQVSAFFVNLWNTIKGLFSGIGAWFTSVFGQAASGVQSAWSGVTGFFSGIWNGIKNIFSAVGNWFSGIFGSAWNGIKSIWSGVTGFFSGIWHGITGIFGSAGNWFGNVFNGAKKAIYDHFSPSALSDHFNNVWKAVQNTFSKLNPMQWGKDLIDGIANGIRSAADHVKQAVGNVATTIRSFLHFSRPDTGDLRDYESWMPDFMKGLANGIRNSTAPVINAAKGVASGIAANIRIPQTVTSGLQLRTALAAAGGYSSGSGGSTSDSISRSPIPGLTVIFKGNSFGNKEVAKTDVDKISNAIALKVQAKK
jgi:phage-related protein